MHKKLVSILIPVYNREKLIKETVLSALSQSYENFEVIIVDNQSTDDTWSILKQLSLQDKRIKIFQNEINIGPVKNWMRCINEAQGVYGKILWSDDLIAPDFIEKTIPFLENNNIGFVFTSTIVFNNIDETKTSLYTIGSTGSYDSEIYIQGILTGTKYPISPGCALFRLNDLKENLLIDIPNKVNSNFAMHAIGNDMLLFLLTAQKYNKFAFVNEKLSFFRDHPDSITISTDNGKLVMYYSLALAYFVENYRTDLIKKLNTNLYIAIKKFSDASIQYGFKNISSFYSKNTDFSLDYIYVYDKLIRNLKNILQKFFK